VRKQFANIENTVTTRYHMLGCGSSFLEAIMVVEGVGKQRQVVLGGDCVVTIGGSQGYRKLLLVVVEDT